MDIKKHLNEKELSVAISGRLDTSTAPELEEEVMPMLDNAEKLILDFTDLAYISSAGLRILLAFQKKMNVRGEMVIKNVNENIKEVFEITGFVDILKIE